MKDTTVKRNRIKDIFNSLINEKHAVYRQRGTSIKPPMGDFFTPDADSESTSVWTLDSGRYIEYVDTGLETKRYFLDISRKGIQRRIDFDDIK